MKTWICLTFLSWITIQECFAYRILGLVPFSGRSHYISVQPIFEELARRGHEVTIVSTYSENRLIPNYTEIIIKKKMAWDYLGVQKGVYDIENIASKNFLIFAWNSVLNLNELVLNSSNFQDYFRNDAHHFDVVFTEFIYMEALNMFAYQYKAPLIGLCAHGYSQHLGELMGNPYNLPHLPHEFLKAGKKLNYYQRLENFLLTMYEYFQRKWYLLPKHQELAEKYFNYLPGPLPKLEDLERNISLVFVNTHYSYDYVRPLVPGIIEVGGVHIKPAKPLPEHINKFLNESTDGVIYFSLGSNINSRDMKPEMLRLFFSAFSKLKQRVIWKWEDSSLLHIPHNVLIGPWFPQNDILAHPNVKLFITQGGLMSSQEAMYHGVPLIGFPFYGDQYQNMKIVEDNGFGVSLSFSKLTEKTFSSALNEILTNPKYMERAKEISYRFKDRPISQMDNAVYWIEYIIRHKGAPFMKSPFVHMSFMEYYAVDLIVLLVVILAIVYFVIKLVIYLLTPNRKPDQVNKIIKLD